MSGETKEYICRMDKDDKLVVEPSQTVTAGVHLEIQMKEGDGTEFSEVILDRDQAKELKSQIDKIISVTTKKDTFVNFINRNRGRTEGYVWTRMSLPGQTHDEVIVNRVQSVIKKLDHYKEAYNEDMEKKDNKNVKIVSYGFAYDWEEIPEL